MSITDFLGRAVATMKKAVDADNEGNYKQALTLYMSGLDLFMLAIKWEKNEKSKEIIRGRTAEYLDRAEKLKAYVNDEENRKTPGQAATAAGGAGPVNGAKGGKEDKTHEESKAMREQILSNILSEKPDVKWDEVAGLDEAKDQLKMAAIMPIKFPEIYKTMKPSRGILMYGPPGTGKTHLAKAVATEAQSTFFNISSSNLTSKWLGESEKLVRELFTLAREQKPSVIFLDEIDALVTTRGDGESEASKRIKTQFLTEMGGVGKDSTGILVLAATNIPWALDTAILRRFNIKVHIGLPDASARAELFKLAIGEAADKLTKEDFRELAQASDGFSGSDIANVVDSAVNKPIQLSMHATHFRPVIVNGERKLTPCSPGHPEALEMGIMDLQNNELYPPPVMAADFLAAVRKAKSSVTPEDLEKHREWTEQYGQEGS